MFSVVITFRRETYSIVSSGVGQFRNLLFDDI